MEKTDMRELLAHMGLPQFELGDDGYPLPGKVVKFYREQKTYTGNDGKVKHWTQADLAKRLGLTDIMVNLNVDHIEKLYHKLLASSYGNSPDVANLAIHLRSLRQP